MVHTTLVSTAVLAAHLYQRNWAIIDCRFQLKDDEYGRRAYEAAHIPGAVYADLNEHLSGPILPRLTGRHPLPGPDQAAQRFSGWGIGPQTQVVAYDDQGGALAAARLWWMLRWLGHEQVALLDGGWPKWLSEVRPALGGLEERSPANFRANVRRSLVIEAHDVLQSIGDLGFRLFDSRTAERYRGENETIDPVAGRIPGAVSAPYPENLALDGTFRPAEQLRLRYGSLLGDLRPEKTAFYCGSGVTAPHNILAMMHAGLGEARLYAGSWSDWILDPARPIKTGG